MGVLFSVIVALFVQGAQPQLQARPQQQSSQSDDRQEPAAQHRAAGRQSPSSGDQPAVASEGRAPDQSASSGGQSSASPQQGSSDDIWSIEHIKKALEHKPALTYTMPDPNSPRYRVEIQGQRALTLPSWQQSFQIPAPPVPQPFGGQDYWNMMRVNTPSQFWGSAPFNNTDLLKMYGLTGAYGLAGALIKKGIEARQNAAAARARQEVLQELADLEEHNARIAAGQDDDSAKTADEKKKQQEAEKKKKKKKNEKQQVDRLSTVYHLRSTSYWLLATRYFP